MGDVFEQSQNDECEFPKNKNYEYLRNDKKQKPRTPNNRRNFKLKKFATPNGILLEDFSNHH